MKSAARFVANVLPADARDALVRASQVKIPRSDALWRQKAIEEVTQRIKFQYPQFFRHKADI